MDFIEIDNNMVYDIEIIKNYAVGIGFLKIVGRYFGDSFFCLKRMFIIEFCIFL